MNGKLAERWYAFCMFVLRVAYVNLLWTVFTLLGLVIIGIGPATVAMQSVFRQFIRGNTDAKIFSFFLKSYKENFIQASLLGVGYLSAGIILATNIIFFASFFARIFFILMAVLYLISLTYIGPVMVHFECKEAKKKIKASLIFGFSYLQYTLVMFGAIGIALVVILFYHGAFLIFGAGVYGYISMWFCNQVFKRAELEALQR